MSKSLRHVILFICLFMTAVSVKAEKLDADDKLVYGNDSTVKFSPYQPTYFVMGKDDIKLQLSGKYRIARNFNLYAAFTQTMFWSIFSDSQPFKDINYNPEMFYRLVEIDSDTDLLKSIDFGFVHRSNGKDGPDSRSVNRVFVKTNLVTQIGRHDIVADLMVYKITDDEKSNDSRKYLGYWDFIIYVSDLVRHNNSRLNLQFKLNAGANIYNTNMGGRTIGLIYDFGSENFNPSLYLQYYSGYMENLLEYNKNTDQVRLGFLLYL